MVFGLSFSVISQTPVKSVGDTLGPWSVISFEEPSQWLSILPGTDNIWQIGYPQKTIFNAAYTPPKAIVTDTINVYPPLNESSFIVKIGNFNSFDYPWNIFVDFRHKFNTDTLQDGGWISVSWDHGISWYNVIKDTVSLNFFYGTPTRSFFWPGNTGLYDTTSVLCNGQPGFTGNSNGWVHSCLAWYDIPLKSNGIMIPDTMLLKFNFVSDPVQTNKEGWMIDQIRLFSIDLGSGMENREGNLNSAKIVPNPVKEQAAVILPEYCDKFDYQITSAAGNLIMERKNLSGKWFILERNDLPGGIYCITILNHHSNSRINVKIAFL